MNNLQGKKILFFCPAFFGYDKEITAQLRAMGAEVDCYDERPRNNFFTKAAIRLNKKIVKRKIRHYYNKILATAKSKKYDYVFVVNIEAILPEILKALKNQQTAATFILYMWDSIRNKKYTRDLIPYFNHVFSFDPLDSKELGCVNFRSLFFTNKYAGIIKRDEKPNYDFCFIGTVHSDRYSLLKHIKGKLENQGLKGFFYMFFPSKVRFFQKKLLDSSFITGGMKEFNFKSLSQDQSAKLIANSNVILDIQHPAQTGLTMRTIEMIGAEKKIITTNNDIKNYDFYDPQNILIINRHTPVLDFSFFQRPYKAIPPKIKYRYSLKGWIEEIFATTE